MLLKQLLSVIWAVKRISLGVASRTGVVATDDEMCAPIVFPDDGVPHSLARASHAHCQRQEGQLGCVLGVVGQQRLITADSRVMIHVTRLGHPDHGMDQEIGFHLLGCA